MKLKKKDFPWTFYLLTQKVLEQTKRHGVIFRIQLLIFNFLFFCKNIKSKKASEAGLQIQKQQK